MAGPTMETISLIPDPSFNWFFLLELIVSCILVLFFLLYFNRLFGTLLSYGIRAYTWHYYRAYVDIHALQISLLGGRIFFKGIRYHGVNETIFVHGGFITWRYWKRAVRRTDLSQLRCNEMQSESVNDSSIGEKGGVDSSDNLPCRITIKFYGLEWFVYNRTPAYDSILTGFRTEQPFHTSTLSQDPSLKEKSPDAFSSTDPSSLQTSALDNDILRNGTGRDTVGSEDAQRSGQEIGDSLSRMLRLLPLKLECDKGALVMGNEHTRSVLTTTFDAATGSIEASNAGPLDLYRQIFSFKINRPVVQMRPNPDYKQDQLAAAKGLRAAGDDNKPGAKRKRDTIFNYQFQKRRVWHSIRDLIPYFQTSVESFHITNKRADLGPRNPTDLRNDSRWVGLSRYLDDSSQDDHGEWDAIEYGRFSTILDSPSMVITYFWDIPGVVVSDQSRNERSSPKISLDINGASPPEWGIDVKIEGGTINYGPWADRERVGLQNIFFPSAYRSSEPAEHLATGDLRQNSVFKLRVEINQETTLRIPTREPSKDWLWKGRADAVRGATKLKKKQQRRQTRAAEGEKGHIGPDIRPFGWFALRVAADSTINYTMDMVASTSGFSTRLDLDLHDSRMTSSVNHAVLWQCPRQLVSCDLSVPLSWNSLRTWKFDVDSQNMQMFLLRDHIFLLTDLITDWGSGPPQEYYTFVPFIYHLNMSFADIQLFLNVNDSNIISDPADLDDNRLLVIKGRKLASDITIPLNKYNPEQNAVTFNVSLSDIRIDFLAPMWDTFHTFLKNNSVATLENLIIDGSYNYFATTSDELIDTLLLNIDGLSPTLYLFGFLIKCFMIVKENYFGEEIHFKTLEEFQELAYSQEEPEANNGINPNRKTNDLDVVLHVTVDNARALLPENLYEDMTCVRLTAPSLEVDLRFTNYYMDMQFSLAPLSAGLESHQEDEHTGRLDTQLFVDGVSIYGHRIFGLPPTEPTYVCNWDFDVGRIIGECSPRFLSCLAAGLQSFDISFDNEENALPPLFPLVLHDVTFLRANFDTIHISVLLDNAVLLLSTGPVTTKFNDWANAKFSKRMSLLVPDVSISAIDYKFLGRFGTLLESKILPLAMFQTSIKLKMAQRKNDIVQSRRFQQEHIKSHDQRTQRTPWLVFDWDEIEPDLVHMTDHNRTPPTIAIPTMPEPIARRFSALNSSPLKRQSGNRSNASSRSFLLSQNRGGTQGKAKKGANNVDKTSSISYSEAKELGVAQQILGNNRTPHSLTGRKSFTKDIRNAPEGLNPWCMPGFSLHKIKLNTSQLPSSQVPIEDDARDSFPVTRFEPQFSPFEDENTTYTNFMIDFSSGIRGVCTAEFLFIVSTLLENLQARHPVEVIDMLQKDIMSDIVGYEKSMKNPKKAMASAIKSPIILVKLINSGEYPVDNEIGFQDEYNIEVSNLKTAFGTKVERQKGDLLTGIRQSSTVHVAADSLSVSVESSRIDAYQQKSEFRCLLEDVSFWLVTAPYLRLNLQIRTFNTVTSTKSVEQLAFLVRRTTTMFDSAASSFQHTSSLNHRRMRFLIYFLTKSAANVQDPTFLTRISYVLRIAPGHLRHHDSWKIISRIRNVYNNLPGDQQQDLIFKLFNDDLNLPLNAKSTVVSSFDQWRAWDLAHVGKSYVMKRVWESFEPKPAASASEVYFSSTIKVFRFSIDPGPKESDFVIQSLSTVLSSKPRGHPPMNAEGCSRPLTIFQSYCSTAELRLRWEILDLVEEVAKTMSSVTLESAKLDQDDRGETEEQNGLQFIFGADYGTITLDGINVKLGVLGKSLRSSLVLEPRNAEGLNTVSVLTSAEACSSELSSLSTTLMQWKILDPHMYCSRISHETATELKHEWKMAGSSRKLRYDMKEDPLSLAHTADRVIEDEIQFIHQLIKNLSLPPRQASERHQNQKAAQNKFQIAMFLDDYRLTFCILPSLTYIISGEVARASVISKMESKTEVDFDLKKNLHTFLSNEGGKWQPLSDLEIPPINGRVIANMSPNRTDMEIDVTIELIQLEASAVRSLLGVLTRPEFSHLASDLKQNVEVLRLHYGEVLAVDNSNMQPKDTPDPHVVLYKARMTMAGTRIHATAPALDGKYYSVDMGFSLGMMRMRLDNGLDDGRPMEFPEFHVDTSNIIFDLRKLEASKVRSYCSFAADAKVRGTSVVHDNGRTMRVFHFTSSKFDVELFPETTALIVDLAAHLQERIRTLDLSQEVKRFKKLRHGGQSEIKMKYSEVPGINVIGYEPTQEDLFDAIYSLDLNNIQIGWNMVTAPKAVPRRRPDDLVFSIRRVELSNKRTNSAKLRIEDVQLQMVPFSGERQVRSLNSALLPEVVFNVAYSSIGKDVRLAFQAAGKSLDLRATSDFILPASMIRESIASAAKTIRDANSRFVSKATDESIKPRALFGNKRVHSVLVDVDFAGAIVTLQGRQTNDQQTLLTATLKGRRMSESKYGQYVQGDAVATATLRAPGVALKVQFEDNASDNSTLNAELKIDASTNVLYPSLVPLIKQISTTVKEVMGDPQKPRRPSNAMMLQSQRLMQEAPLDDDPNSILGRCKLNVGLLIRKQEFSLSCQPIARVAATAAFDSVYVAVNTVQSDDHGRFLALSVAFNSLRASVKHVYSNESTASFEVQSMIMSLMNSKHLGKAKGISAALRVSPMQVTLNAKQLQDLLLFREIWIPSNEEMGSEPDFQTEPSETQAYIVQRYQQVASAPAFPWNSTIAIEKLKIQLDLGSTLGKAQFAIDDLWLSAKKTSDREQILCIGFETVAAESKGRMSGLVELQKLKIRTSINWPDDDLHSQTPLIQALISFSRLQVKMSFDYQPFLIAHISVFAFLMYNVRSASSDSNERLFSILEGDQVQVFCTSLTASQSLALFQAWQRLVQDKQAAYEASLSEVERYLRRKTSIFTEKAELSSRAAIQKVDEEMQKAPISLQTGVVVTIKAVHIGAFPSTFFDNHVFKLEAHDAQARFDVSLDKSRIHSALGLTLGQLLVALSPITRSGPVAIQELHVDEIADRVIESRGGTILKVPRLVAAMETWQVPGTHQIEYVFRSTFEGKVDVGWNYSRISFIRDMWETHSRALASRLGKPLAPSAVRITGGLNAEGGGDGNEQQEKITAVVNVPQSKYTYVAMEPPVIETPQLRDMGEATPPLEWIGLQRDKLPNVTHQIIIVTLLEIAKEVEDAYGKILWSS